ncbi:galactose mutarotase [Qipengyuania sp. XHP0211]|uniref:aldose epimerase family protein n=1 Tax=Qipengyuania sp. XHP0211 TaxID=3038079 RepID=UPI00241D0439|nr:aldose epimerase family protein [Qipengyuania sp. XHP0211]MDG5751554.1 galactose mutarotase [Qipengyuania sp. XHP0211]
MVRKQFFETLPDGRDVHCWRLESADGAGLTVMDLGATILSLEVADRRGELADVVLGYDSATTYLSDPHFHGAVIGRFANRIAGARFTLDGRTYDLDANQPPNALDGGHEGFDKRIWSAEACTTSEGNGVLFTLDSADGDEGYPGNLRTTVSYVWTEDHRLVIDYAAETDAPTPFNPTHHSYWNLAGAGAPSVLDHVLEIHADRYLPVTPGLIPTGALADVASTPLDFREPKPLDRDIDAPDAQLALGKGYDHCFALNGAGVRKAAALFDPASGRRMTVHTDLPGLQLYSANFLGDKPMGKHGKNYAPRSAVALETQFFPDSPNQPHFPDTILRPGRSFASRTIYAFDCAEI